MTGDSRASCWAQGLLGNGGDCPKTGIKQKLFKKEMIAALNKNGYPSDSHNKKFIVQRCNIVSGV